MAFRILICIEKILTTLLLGIGIGFICTAVLLSLDHAGNLSGSAKGKTKFVSEMDPVLRSRLDFQDRGKKVREEVNLEIGELPSENVLNNLTDTLNSTNTKKQDLTEGTIDILKMLTETTPNEKTLKLNRGDYNYDAFSINNQIVVQP